MKRILLDKDIYSVSDFRANANALIKHVKQTKRPLVLTQHGKSTAVVIDVGEYENLLQEIDLLADIRKARIEIENGKGIPHDRAYKKK